MNLKDLSLTEAKMATSHFPLLLTGANSSGKSRALENMSAEDKARTVVLNYDIKPIGDGSPSEFHTLFSISSTAETLDNQIAVLNAKGKELKAENPQHPALPRLREQVAHIKNIKKTSYFIDDVEAVDKMVADILTFTFDPDVDRLVVDTFSSLVDFCEAWANKNFAGREVWANYGTALQKILQAIKEATIFGSKYTYIYAHHAFIPALQYATTPKEVVAVKGGIMKNNVETHFNTVVFAYVTEDGHRMFECDVNNSLDTSRTKLVEGKFSFVRESLDDLEQLFAGHKVIVDGVLAAPGTKPAEPKAE